MVKYNQGQLSVEINSSLRAETAEFLMYEQTEYVMAYALTAAFVALGMLLVCVPRPRKSDFPDPVRDAKLKKLKARDKSAAKAKRDVAKVQKAALRKRKKATKAAAAKAAAAKETSK